MKLRDGFLTHTMGDEHVLVATGEAAERFHGIARGNETAAFIIECLKSETTAREIVAKMLAEYDAEEERVTTDVAAVLDQLRSIGAIVE